MNTNTTLTERDKKLLNLLAYVVIIFVFVWCIIRPLCNRIITIRTMNDIKSNIIENNRYKMLNTYKLVNCP